MDNRRWHEIQLLCKDALDRPATEQDRFLDETCGGDPALRREVESLLARREGAAEFMEQPALELAARLETLDAHNIEPDLTGQTISRYRIVEKIGSTGMGAIYKAEDCTLDRFVALKFLSRAALSSLGDGDSAFRRLQREARASSALDHPGICTVFDVDHHDGAAFIAMQFLDGRTLKSMISGEPLPIDQILSLGIRLADALGAAHAAGIVHRDVKSSNIFVTKRGEVKILDFGLAGLAAREAPSSDQGLYGTLPYMSPEQLLGEADDARADLYSFGVVLYEMATGSLPCEHHVAVTDSDTRAAIRPPSTLNPALPRRFDQILSKTLEQDRDRRYQTAGDLRGDLEQLQMARNARGIFARKSWIAASLVILFGLGVIGIASLYWHSAVPLTPRDLIVPGDFVNRTGDPVFDVSLGQALRAQLEQSPYLNVVSDENIHRQLRYMKRAPGTMLTPDVAREICIRAGAAAVIGGSIAQLGSHFVVGLDARNCHTGDTLASEEAEAQSRESVLHALDSAAMNLRARLGESLTTIRKYDTPVEEATTSSLEALRAYSLGVETRLSAGDEAAIPFFRKAIALDPDFAMAYAHLAAACFNLHQSADMNAAFARAYALRGRVSERERLYIEGHYYLFATGEAEKAIQSFQEWKRIYTEDPGPRINLGVLYSTLGQHANNLTEQLSALRLDPGNALAYTNAVQAAIDLNRFDKAETLLDLAARHKINYGLFQLLRYQLAFHRRDEGAMSALLKDSIGAPDLHAWLLSLQADTEAYRGHLERARDFGRQAVEIAKTSGDSESAAGYLAANALRETEIGDLNRALDEARAAMTAGQTQSVQVVAALAMALAGDSAHALAAADTLARQYKLDTLVNDYWLPLIRAGAALHDNEPARAVEWLRIAAPYELAAPVTQASVNGFPIYLRAKVFLAEGNAADAAHEFQKLIALPGLMGNSPAGVLALLDVARAEALAARGASSDQPAKIAQAKQSYESLLSLWKSADPGLDLLAQSKTEYRSLH